MIGDGKEMWKAAAGTAAFVASLLLLVSVQTNAQTHSFYLCDTAKPKHCVTLSYDNVSLSITSDVSTTGKFISINGLKTGTNTSIDVNNDATFRNITASQNYKAGSTTVINNTADGTFHNLSFTGTGPYTGTGDVTITASNIDVPVYTAGAGISIIGHVISTGGASCSGHTSTWLHVCQNSTCTAYSDITAVTSVTCP